MGSETPAPIPMLTINTLGKGDARESRYRLSFGEDTHYDMLIEVGPGTGDIDTAPDGVFKPACAFILGGLDNSKNAKEIQVYRCFGEDDLRWIARACLEAAARMKRTESARRRRKNHTPTTQRGEKGAGG